MRKLVLLTTCVGLIVAIGCSRGRPATSAASAANGTPLIDGSKYLLSTEPSEAVEVIKMREAAKDGDEVVIVGRIGGGVNPWIDGRAAFSIVDGSLKACSDIPGDQCEKPWDYCCETDKLPTATALVKVVDENGDLLNADARELLHVKELSTVVVQGIARRDEAGNLTVLASGVYVKN
jgi:hypothetical protein